MKNIPLQAFWLETLVTSFERNLKEVHAKVLNFRLQEICFPYRDIYRCPSCEAKAKEKLQLKSVKIEVKLKA